MYRDRRIILHVYKNQEALMSQDRLQAKISKGVGQRCGLAPLLFNLYVEYMKKEFMGTSNSGIIFNGICYETMYFADDIVLHF